MAVALKLVEISKEITKTFDLSDHSWILEAIQFGHNLADRFVRDQKETFTFINSPVESCLSGFIALGTILRRETDRFQLAELGKESNPENPADAARAFSLYLRLWESGLGTPLVKLPTRNRAPIFEIKDIKYADGGQGFPHGFRNRIPTLVEITGSSISIARPRQCTKYIIGPKNLGSGNDRNKYAPADPHFYNRSLIRDILRKESWVADPGKPPCEWYDVSLCCPRRNLFQDWNFDAEGKILTLPDILNLDKTGKSLSPSRHLDGSWLNPLARFKKNESPIQFPDRGIVIFDGAEAWKKFRKHFRSFSKVIVYSRSCKAKHTEDMRLIVDQGRNSILNRRDRAGDSGLVTWDHPWLDINNAPMIRAFVYAEGSRVISGGRTGDA